MGNQTLIYKEKFLKTLKEVEIHLKRIDEAFFELSKKYNFPISDGDFEKILSNKIDLAFADQIIYRFSKAQDTIGAKLFKSYLLLQGENVDKPFLDILDRFEKMKIINIDEWFLLREIRNEIAHEYEDDTEIVRSVLNSIYKHKNKLQSLVNEIKNINVLPNL